MMFREAKPAQKKNPTGSFLVKLREGCEKYDMDSIDEVMKELESSDYDEDADLIKWIREKIDVSKIGEVSQRLASV